MMGWVAPPSSPPEKFSNAPLEADDLVIHPVEPGLTLLHQLRLEAAVPVPGNRDRQSTILPFSTLVDMPLRRLDWLGGALSPAS